MTFFNELTTQSKTALSLGTRLIVFNGRNTLNTRSDLMVDKFELTLPEVELKYIIKSVMYNTNYLFHYYIIKITT